MDSLKLIYGSTKLNIEVSGWLFQTHIDCYQENDQSFPSYFMAFGETVKSWNSNWTKKSKCCTREW